MATEVVLVVTVLVDDDIGDTVFNETRDNHNIKAARDLILEELNYGLEEAGPVKKIRGVTWGGPAVRQVSADMNYRVASEIANEVAAGMGLAASIRQAERVHEDWMAVHGMDVGMLASDMVEEEEAEEEGGPLEQMAQLVNRTVEIRPCEGYNDGCVRGGILNREADTGHWHVWDQAATPPIRFNVHRDVPQATEIGLPGGHGIRWAEQHDPDTDRWRTLDRRFLDLHYGVDYSIRPWED